MRKKLPYGKQTIDKDDIKAVSKALKNEIISGCGPVTVEFEKNSRILQMQNSLQHVLVVPPHYICL